MNKSKRLKARIKTLVVDLIENRRDIWMGSFFLKLLFFLSLIVRSYVKWRRKFYKRKRDQLNQPPIVSVCIGNISAGGTGKTPTTIFLAEELKKSYKVAVVSRGYQGEKTKSYQSFEVKPSDCPKLFGDEPIMIKQKSPSSYVVVGKNRQTSLEQAYEARCDVALLDDGLQHFKVQADLKVAMIKSLDSLKKGHFLPRGYLREEPSVLSEVDYIGLTESFSLEKFEEEKKYLERLTSAKIFGLRPTDFTIKGAKEIKLQQIKNKKVGLFSAIAHPKSFKRSLMDLGVDILEEYYLVDHSFFEEDQLRKFITRCQQKKAEFIFCTLKDYVKLSETTRTSHPILYLDYSLKVFYHKEVFQNLLEDITQRVEDYKIKREASL